MDPLMPVVFGFLDYQSVMSAARVCAQFRAVAHRVEGMAYERAMLAATCAQLGRRLQTTAYVDALDDVSDDERQVAFNQGFAMATGPTYSLSYYRGLLLTYALLDQRLATGKTGPPSTPAWLPAYQAHAARVDQVLLQLLRPHSSGLAGALAEAVRTNAVPIRDRETLQRGNEVPSLVPWLRDPRDSACLPSTTLPMALAATGQSGVAVPSDGACACACAVPMPAPSVSQNECVVSAPVCCRSTRSTVCFDTSAASHGPDVVTDLVHEARTLFTAMAPHADLPPIQ